MKIHDFENPDSQWFWWWRNLGPGFSFDEVTFRLRPPAGRVACLFNRLEPCALGYEVSRRYDRTIRSCPYINADLVTRNFLRVNTHSPYVVFDCEDRVPSDGRIRIPSMDIPSGISRRAIRRIVDETVKQEDKKRGIQRSKGPPHGTRNRPISWQMVEVLDIADFNTRLLNPSERSTLSRVRALAQKLHSTVVDPIITYQPQIHTKETGKQALAGEIIS